MNLTNMNIKPLLSPIVGTSTGADREALHSLIRRLSEKNQISVNTLVKELVLPLLGVKSSLRSKMNTRGYLISNGGQQAVRWCDSIQQICVLEDLLSFTLREANSLRGVARITCTPTRKWCPTCFNEDLATSTGPYDRLLWIIKDVEVCPKHTTRLEHTCPHCGKGEIPTLLARDCSGFCPYCLKWLGVNPVMLDPNRDEHTRYLLWCAKSFSDFLNSPISLDLDSGFAVRSMLGRIAQQHFSGRTTHLARALDRNKSVISTWMTGRGQVSWRALCDISYVFHIPVVDILTCQTDAIVFSMIRPLPLSKSRAGRRQRKIAVHHDLNYISAFFGAVESGHHSSLLTLEAIAARLNTSVRELRRIFPDRIKNLARTLEDRRRRAKQIKNQQRKDLLEYAVPEAVRGILLRGEALTRRALSHELFRAGVEERRSEQPKIKKLKLKALENLTQSFPAIHDRPAFPA